MFHQKEPTAGTEVPTVGCRLQAASRVPDAEELLDIFVVIAKEQKNLLEPAAEEKLERHIEHILQERQQSFGNGRAMRNLFEECRERQANRLAGLTGKLSAKDLIILTSEDVPEISA